MKNNVVYVICAFFGGATYWYHNGNGNDFYWNFINGGPKGYKSLKTAENMAKKLSIRKQPNMIVLECKVGELFCDGKKVSEFCKGVKI